MFNGTNGSAPGLASTNWLNLGGAITATNGSITSSDLLGAASQRSQIVFYLICVHSTRSHIPLDSLLHPRLKSSRSFGMRH